MNEMETRKKPRKIGKGSPPEGKPFSKENQPQGKAKSDGWARRKKGMALVRAILALKFKGLPDSKIKANVSKMFSVPIEDLTVEDMGHFRQAELMITKADTAAYKALLAHSGNFKSEINLTGEVNNNVKMTLNDLSTEQLEKMLEIFNAKK